MNPGKIIDTPPMTENLRFGTAYQASSPIATLDFSADTNFAGAVEQCNGMGACRKTEGIMCPSYMVTQEEEHSTRGRANLLRAVLSGALPKETLTSKRLYETMDLCIECKGCKAECPSGVDMAKLKYEFLDKYTQANGLSLRGRIFANVNTLSRLACRLAPLSNWLVGNRLSKRLMHSLLGVEAKREPPHLRPPHLPRLVPQAPSPCQRHPGTPARRIGPRTGSRAVQRYLHELQLP